jgi:hypothetical protein
MEIDKLRSRSLLGDLSEMGALAKLEEGYRYATDTGDWRGFAGELEKHGASAARQLWDFLDGVPQRAGTAGHLHFATGMEDTAMAPPGSMAEKAAIKWSDLLSEAIDLVGYDFAAKAPDRLASARETFDRMDKVLSEADRIIAARLVFFQGTGAGELQSRNVWGFG